MIAAGGRIEQQNNQFRVNGQLAVSRAFGDMFLYPAVRPDPDIHVNALKDDAVRGGRRRRPRSLCSVPE